MTPYDPKNRRQYPSATLYEYAVQRDRPESAVPLGNLPGAEIVPAVQSVEDLLLRLMAQGSTGRAMPRAATGASMPSPASGPFNMRRRNEALAVQPMPGYRPRPPLGYRIPIIPPREKPAPFFAELLGIPTSPEAERKALYDNMLRAAVAERQTATRSAAEAKKIMPVTQESARTGPMESATKTAQAERAAVVDEFASPVTIQRSDADNSSAAVFDAQPPRDTPVDETKMLNTLDFDAGGASERQVLLQHPFDTFRVNSAADESIKAAIDRFTRPELENGPGDAFRHALWSYKLTRTLGAERAKAFTDSHEISNPNSRDVRLMDLYNNSVGRRLAADPDNHSKQDEAVILEALKRGELQEKPVLIASGTQLSPNGRAKSDIHFYEGRPGNP
jgi:Domain of unknown function (DUF6973)